jgi:hypothetical protein
MKMRNQAILFGILLILLSGCGKKPNDDTYNTVTPEPMKMPQQNLDGIYKVEGKESGGFEIKGNKMISTDPVTGKKMEVSFEQKGNCIYVKPYIPEGEKIVRNIVVVYKIVDKGLESTHVEDAYTGERLNAEMPKVLYVKQ